MAPNWVTVVFSWICIVLEVKLSNELNHFEEGFCQVYSYNIKDRRTGLSEKHFFSCCNNMEEKSCQGNTYQKPRRTECKFFTLLFCRVSSSERLPE